MPVGYPLFQYTDIITFLISSVVLWISGKFLGARLSFFFALVITIIGTLFGRLAPVVLPNLNIFLIGIGAFVIRVVLISIFGQVGILRAVLISLFPLIVGILIGVLLIGTLAIV